MSEAEGFAIDIWLAAVDGTRCLSDRVACGCGAGRALAAREPECFPILANAFNEQTAE
jgi:hypothetical protein